MKQRRPLEDLFRFLLFLPEQMQWKSLSMTGEFDVNGDERDMKNYAEKVNDVQRPIEESVGMEKWDQVVSRQQNKREMLRESPVKTCYKDASNY